MRQEEAGCARLGAPAQPVPAVERHREAALHSSTSGWWFWQAGWYFPSGGMAGDTQNTVFLGISGHVEAGMGFLPCEMGS